MSPYTEFIEPLFWDTHHFGVSTAKITAKELSDHDLEETLQMCKEKGYQLVYWFSPSDRKVPSYLLRSFSGILADRKATYHMDLSINESRFSKEKSCQSFEVSEYPKGPSTADMLSLAVLSGKYSRFKKDSWVGREKFESLYHIWMKQSTLREIADMVFVVKPCSDRQKIVGMVSVSAKKDIGQIGLLSIAEEMQGKGLGCLLLEKVRQWMCSENLKISEVVTQYENLAARGLFEKFGYQQKNLENVCHFWPQ